MKIQVLVAAMNQTDHSLIEKMNIKNYEGFLFPETKKVIEMTKNMGFKKTAIRNNRFFIKNHDVLSYATTFWSNTFVLLLAFEGSAFFDEVFVFVCVFFSGLFFLDSK